MSERQSVRAVETSLSTENWNRERMEHWRFEVAAADAKKVGSESDAARRIPKPPFLTGVLACIHCVSDMCSRSLTVPPAARRRVRPIAGGRNRESIEESA